MGSAPASTGSGPAAAALAARGPAGRRRFGAPRSRCLRVARERCLGRRCARLSLQSVGARAPPLGRRTPLAPPLAHLEISFRRTLGAGAGLPRLGRRQGHASTARFRETDRDRLLARARAVFALANVIDLFSHELASGGARALALLQIPLGSFDCLFLRHGSFSSRERRLDTLRWPRGADGSTGTREPCRIRSKDVYTRPGAPAALDLLGSGT